VSSQIHEASASERGTRERILEAAWSLIVERGIGGASMGEIARAAKVSRQAVYLHFGSRAGLLIAMTRHHDRNSRIVAALRALRERPGEARLLDDYFDLWLDYVPEIFPVARVLSAAAATDPEAAVAWNDRMEELRFGIGWVMQRLRAAGLLDEAWTTAAATDWAWSQSHVDVWRHLVVERGWSPKEAKARIIATLRLVLLNERAATPSPA
jgi:AcrR family transcriptional regulator